jgi:outer membrane protein assembly factor BamB
MRLRVPAAIAALALPAFGYIWLISDLMRQIQVMASVAVLSLAFMILFVWFVLFSGAPGKARAAVALGLAALALISGGLFRIRGVTGDLIPIVEYRFASARALPEAQPRGPEATPQPERDASGDTSTGTPAAVVASAEESPRGGEVKPAPPQPATPKAEPLQPGWPQYLGPNRSGSLADVRLDTDWAARPPRLLWRQPVGAGWAGFAVSSGVAVTQEQRGSEEHTIAYELRTGRPLWSHRDNAFHDSPLGGVGPRGVPAIDSGEVFALGATGILKALDLRTGRLLWSRNILEDNNAKLPEWGVAISPLVHQGRVIVSAGGKPGKGLVAYDRATGAPLWAAGNGGLAYASPVIMNLAGREQIVMLNSGTVAGHDPQTGSELWTHDVPNEPPRAAQPLPISENRVLFSIGYGIGSRVFEVSPRPEGGLVPRLMWSTPRLKSKFANMILHQGSVYGLDDGVFVCLDPQTGERRWKDGRFGHGQLILAGEHLLVQTEGGEVLIIEPNPERLVVVARFQALDGKTWNPPAFPAPILLVRNDTEAAAYELSVR